MSHHRSLTVYGTIKTLFVYKYSQIAKINRFSKMIVKLKMTLQSQNKDNKSHIDRSTELKGT